MDPSEILQREETASISLIGSKADAKFGLRLFLLLLFAVACVFTD